MEPPTLAGLPLRPLADAAGGADASSVTSHVLPTFMQSQQQSNWCWSAVATSVGLLFQTGAWTQCGTVNGCLQRSDCCTTPGNCNQYGYLDQSLTYTKSFNGPIIYGTYSPADVEAQVKAGCPVCPRVAWNGGGAHFLAMTGYSYPDADPSAFTIYLQDSIFGTTSMAYADFPAEYHGGATWTNTYLTKPSS